MSTTDEPRTFLSIFPLEIRQQIYRGALQRPNQHPFIPRAKLNGKKNECLGSLAWSPPAINLLRANRQIYQETLPILYGGNSFIVKISESGTDFHEWLQAIGPSNIKLLRSIRIWYDMPKLGPVRNRPLRHRNNLAEPWIPMMEKLISGATGIRDIEVYFYTRSSDMEEITWQHVIGENTSFVRYLTMLKTGTMKVGGFYSKDWVSLLDRKFGPVGFMPVSQREKKYRRELEANQDQDMISTQGLQL